MAAFVAAGALALAAAWVLSAPPAFRVELPDHTPDIEAGEALYHAGSCNGCHGARSEPGVDPALPSGGRPFGTPVGTFYPGNLTPDVATGLGAWSREQFVRAMTQGISPDGAHYFPAFPYPSYRRMHVVDLLDLFGYLRSLPAVRSPPRAADVPLSWLARRGVGLWNRLAFLRTPPPAPADAALARGAYLVQAPGHCGECHTPRDWLMIPDESRYLEGGPHPRGDGKVPSLRGLVARGRYKDAADLSLALRYGETFGYEDLSSGGMADVQRNLEQIPEADVRAIADYLVSLRD